MASISRDREASQLHLGSPKGVTTRDEAMPSRPTAQKQYGIPLSREKPCGFGNPLKARDHRSSARHDFWPNWPNRPNVEPSIPSNSLKLRIAPHPAAIRTGTSTTWLHRWAMYSRMSSGPSRSGERWKYCANYTPMLSEHGCERLSHDQPIVFSRP